MRFQKSFNFVSRAMVPLLILSTAYAERISDRPAEFVLHADEISFQTHDTTLIFPDYLDGGGWTSQLVLANVSTTASAQIVVDVYGQSGQRVRGLFGSATSITIPPLGNKVLQSAGGSSIRRGWIEVETDTPEVSGLLTYRHVQTGIEVGVASVEPGTHFALFVEETTDIGTGLALFKPDSASLIELRIRDEKGSDPLGTAVSAGDFDQRAATIPEWFSGEDTSFLSNFRGLMFLQSSDGSPFVPLGLRFGKQKGSLSSVPIIRMSDSIADDGDCASPNPFGGCDEPGPGTDDPETPPAPAVKPVSGETTELEIIFEDSFKAGETKAYDAQVRTKSPRGSWKTGCTTVTNTAAQAGTGDVTITATGLDPGTTYEVRYRHRNASRCGSGTPGPWSAIGEGRTNAGGSDSPNEDFKAFEGLKIGDDGSVTLQVGGITLRTGSSGCQTGGGRFNGKLYDYHWSAWQRNTGSGWNEVSGSRRTGRLCGYDLSSAGSGRYRLVGDMTLADVRGKYKSANEVTK